MASPLARLNVIADAAQSPTIDDGIRDLAAVGLLIYEVLGEDNDSCNNGLFDGTCQRSAFARIVVLSHLLS